MTNTRQGHLFPLPKIIEFKLTPTQWQTLDWIAFHEGRFVLWPVHCSKTSLRCLIRKRLVEVIGQSPGRYILTALGRMVRGQKWGRRREPTPSPRMLVAAED